MILNHLNFKEDKKNSTFKGTGSVQLALGEYSIVNVAFEYKIDSKFTGSSKGVLQAYQFDYMLNDVTKSVISRILEDEFEDRLYGLIKEYIIKEKYDIS